MLFRQWVRSRSPAHSVFCILYLHFFGTFSANLIQFFFNHQIEVILEDKIHPEFSQPVRNLKASYHMASVEDPTDQRVRNSHPTAFEKWSPMMEQGIESFFTDLPDYVCRKKNW